MTRNRAAAPQKITKDSNFKQADDTLGLHRNFYKNSDYVMWNKGRISK